MATCGDPKLYVQALTALASLGSRLVVGAAGPRLITRVRRLLLGEDTTRPTTSRLVVPVFGAAGLFVLAAQVATVAARHVAHLSGSSKAQQGSVPWGDASEQPGCGVILSDFVSRPDAPVERITIRNTTHSPVNAVASSLPSSEGAAERSCGGLPSSWLRPNSYR